MARANRRSFLAASASAAAAVGFGANASTGIPQTPEPEWRNRVETMAYRQLGRTGMMISEVVCGGDPITLENYKHLEVALDLGLNYLDMAPAYNRGQTEQAYGKLIAASPGRRQQVFLTTKVSNLTDLRNRLYREIFDGLSATKQEEIVQRSKALRAERGVQKPGFFLMYYPGQDRAFDPCYLRVAMIPEFGERVENDPRIRQHILDSVEGSLKRVGTDTFDLLMCPHAADCPEDLRFPEVQPVFQDLKQQGKVRFLGATSHNDPPGVLRAAADAGHYDAVMVAYNVVNGPYAEDAIRYASSKGLGIIAMKSAHAVATHHKSLQPVPNWRVDMVNRIVPGDLKPPLKAYLWSLQNPRISAVISNLWDEAHVRENLALAGRKVEFQPA